METSRSPDARERVAALVDAGLSCHEAARRPGISAASAVGIVQLERRTGGLAPASQGRPRRSRLDAVSDWLKARTFETLFQSLAQTCGLFPKGACRNLFKAARYVAD